MNSSTATMSDCSRTHSAAIDIYSLSPADAETRGDGSAGAMRFYAARHPFHLADLVELWRHRDLVRILALRDLKVRYRQTLVGVAWSILQPAVQIAIFMMLFRMLGARPTTGDTPYPVVLISGLLVWQLFASSLSRATGSLVDNSHLITKVYFPRLVLPLASTLPALIDFAIGSALLAAAMIWCGTDPGWSLMALPMFVLLAVLTALGASVWLSAMNALYRDVGYLVPFLLQIGFFVTPVVYQTAALPLPSFQRFLLSLNPMAGAVEGFRWSVSGQGSVPALAIALSAGFAFLLLVTGLLFFRRVEGRLVDRI